MRNLGRSIVISATVALAAGVSAPAAGASPLGQITEYNAGLNAGAALEDLHAGPDGNVWFADHGTAPAIGEITPQGQITEFTAGLNSGAWPDAMTTGSDGRLWFTDNGTTPAIGAVTTGGQITEYSAGLNSGSAPIGIAVGSDGSLWFGDDGATRAIGRITPSGQITEYSTGLNAGANPRNVALGPDGDIWFTDQGTTPAIGKITPDGQITEYSTGLNSGASPVGITIGPDGNLWFADAGATAAIGRITPAGQITEYSTGLNAKASPRIIALGSDGNLWFTDEGATPALGRITPSGQVTEYSAGLGPGALPGGIVSGPAGDLWFTDVGHTPAIGRIGTGLPIVTGAALSPSPASATSVTISAFVNPGGLPTTFHVDYGPTTAYGASTLAQSVGAGDAPVPVTVSFGPVAPNTTYHFRAVATNAAGTVFGNDLTLVTGPALPLPVAPPPAVTVQPPGLSPTGLLSLIHHPIVKATSVLVRLGCAGSPGQRCRGAVVLEAWERLLGSQVIGLGPRTSRMHRRPVAIGSETFSIPAGAVRMVRVALNAKGLRLLRRFGHLPAVVLVFGSGLGRGTRTAITFSRRGPGP